MKRTAPWSDKEEDEDDSSSDESSSSDTDSDGEDGSGKSKSRSGSDKSSRKLSEAKSAKRKGSGIDFDALRRHGYKGGLSVLKVPPPKEPEQRDWTWSTGKEKTGDQDTEESYKERQKTRAAIADGEELATAITRKDREKMTFAQKEKRKRDLGQASRGKNYVEEEKRMLRDSGVYSGFDC